MPALAECYTVIAPDMRGYGDSAKPATGYDARTLAEDFRALVQQLDLAGEPITLVAHDMGAPPALVYAAEYPDEVRALVYLDESVLTSKNLQQVHSFTPKGTRNGGLWWWAFGLATDMPERLVVGKEREFLTWFYHTYTHDQGASVEEAATAEYLRSFSGPAGVRGAFGVYRDVFATVEQTEKYDGLLSKINVPVLGLGGALSMGDKVKQMLEGVARHVWGGAVPDCGHFIPDEQPKLLLDQIDAFLADVA